MSNFTAQSDSAATPGLEEQIAKLRELGIHFRISNEELLHRLTKYGKPAYYEEEPYSRLLSNLIDNESPNVWTFDIECVESPDIYERYISKMIALAEGRIQITDLKGKFDPAEEWTALSFIHQGKRHEFRAENNGDWFDVDVLGRIAYAVGSPDCRFIHHWNDQTLTIVCCTLAAEKELGELTNHKYMHLI